MKNYLFGFIGAGNMGGALAKAAAKSTKEILICDKDKEKAKSLAKKTYDKLDDME